MIRFVLSPKEEMKWRLKLLVLCLGLVKATQAATRAEKRALRKANWAEALALETEIAAAQSQLDQLQTSVDSLTSGRKKRHTWSATSTDKVLVVDAYLGTGDKCGKQTITGWTSNLDIYYAGSTTTEQTAATFNTGSGTFTAPAEGWYNICASLRFKKGGNSNDVTLKKNGNVIAAFGNAIDWDWRSTGTCTVQKLAANDQITLVHESTGGSDCIQETGWLYGRFLVNMVANSS